MSKEIAKQLVDKYIKSFGDTEIPIDEMYYNEAKSDGIMMRNFLEDFAEDILDQQTKELQQRVEQLQFELKAADSVNEQFQTKIEELKLENNNLESRIRSWDKMYKTLLNENLEFKSKLFNEREYSSRRNDDIKALEEDNQQLQSRISELEKANYSLKEAFKRGSELNDKLKFD